MKFTLLASLLFTLASTNANAIDFSCPDEYGFKEDLSNSIQILEHDNNFYEIYLPKVYEQEDLALVQSIFSDEQGYFQLSFSEKGDFYYTHFSLGNTLKTVTVVASYGTDICNYNGKVEINAN